MKRYAHDVQVQKLIPPMGGLGWVAKICIKEIGLGKDSRVVCTMEAHGKTKEEAEANANKEVLAWIEENT